MNTADTSLLVPNPATLSLEEKSAVATQDPTLEETPTQGSMFDRGALIRIPHRDDPHRRQQQQPTWSLPTATTALDALALACASAQDPPSLHSSSNPATSYTTTVSGTDKAVDTSVTALPALPTNTNSSSKSTPTKPKNGKSDPAASDLLAYNIGEHDVLCGRGGLTNHHPGNVYFRQLVRFHQEVYLKASKRDKAGVAKEIVQTVRKQEGRFLKKTTQGDYVDIGDRKAREKTSQALREGAPELRHGLIGAVNNDKDDGTRTASIVSTMPSIHGFHIVNPHPAALLRPMTTSTTTEFSTPTIPPPQDSSESQLLLLPNESNEVPSPNRARVVSDDSVSGILTTSLFHHSSPTIVRVLTAAIDESPGSNTHQANNTTMTAGSKRKLMEEALPSSCSSSLRSVDSMTSTSTTSSSTVSTGCYMDTTVDEPQRGPRLKLLKSRLAHPAQS